MVGESMFWSGSSSFSYSTTISFQRTAANFLDQLQICFSYSLDVPNPKEANKTNMEIYYIRSHPKWPQLIPYGLPVAIFAFATNQFAYNAWNYVDLMIMSLSRTVYFKFKTLHRIGEQLLNGKGKHGNRSKDEKHSNQCFISSLVKPFSAC